MLFGSEIGSEIRISIDSGLWRPGLSARDGKTEDSGVFSNPKEQKSRTSRGDLGYILVISLFMIGILFGLGAAFSSAAAAISHEQQEARPLRTSTDLFRHL